MPSKPIDLRLLGEYSKNIYEAVVIMSKRARQINEEMKIEFNQRIEMLQSLSYEAEDESERPQTNPDQILIAKEFEIRPKPTEIAAEELLTGRLTYRYKEDESTP